MTQISDGLDGLTAPPQKGLNIRPLLRIAQRKALLIIGVAGVVSAGAAALLSRTKPPPVFAGNFQILVEPVTSEAKMSEPTALTRTTGAPNDSLFRLDYPTQLQILQSPRMLSEIVEQVQTRYPNFSINNLRKGLVVERIGKGRFDQTKVLNIQYQGSNAERVQFVLEKTADRYLEYSLEERKTRIGEGVEFIEEQLPDLQERVDTYQSQLQQLQQQYELIDPSVRGEQLYGQIRDLKVQELNTQRELRELRSLYTNLQEQLDLSPDEALVASALSQNPYRSNLLAQLKEIDSQMAVESATFNSVSPEMQRLEEQRQNLLELLNEETQGILEANSVLSPIQPSEGNSSVFAFQPPLRQGQIQQLVETTNQIEVLEVRLATLRGTREDFEQQARQFPALSRQYLEIQQQLQLTNQTLNQLLTQREKLRVEVAQDNFPWELISPAQISRDPEGLPVALPQDSSKKLMMGVVGGLLLGMVAAMTLEQFRDIFYTPEDLQDSVEPPLLGMIPLQETTEFSRTSSLLPWSTQTPPVGSGSLSPFLDAFDALYANIRFLYADAPIRSLVVSSAECGDGKSTVALQLAQTVANMGQRVLFVDANLREPQLHTRLGIPNQKGLSDLLIDKLVPNSLVEQFPLADNFFVLTAGKPSSKSIKLLGSAQMQHIVEEFQATFDFVIYDTPNLQDCMDAIFLATHTDGILTVVGFAKTRKSVFVETLEQLNTFRIPVLGVVLDQVQPQFSTASPNLYGGATELSEELQLDSFERSHLKRYSGKPD